MKGGGDVHSAMATSKKALVNVVLSLVQAHEKFRAQLRKYSRLFTVPYFSGQLGAA